jgi:single-strand DNA-binding protein
MNIVVLAGRVGRDPEEFSTPNGVGCRFSLATTEFSGGEKKTAWHNCVAFGKTAEFILKYIAKGSLLLIHGKISYKEYAKNDVKMISTNIVADRVEPMSSITHIKREEKEQDLPLTPPEDDGIPF